MIAHRLNPRAVTTISTSPTFLNYGIRKTGLMKMISVLALHIPHMAVRGVMAIPQLVQRVGNLTGLHDAASRERLVQGLIHDSGWLALLKSDGLSMLNYFVLAVDADYDRYGAPSSGTIAEKLQYFKQHVPIDVIIEDQFGRFNMVIKRCWTVESGFVDLPAYRA